MDLTPHQRERLAHLGIISWQLRQPQPSTFVAAVNTVDQELQAHRSIPVWSAGQPEGARLLIVHQSDARPADAFCADVAWLLGFGDAWSCFSTNDPSECEPPWQPELLVRMGDFPESTFASPFSIAWSDFTRSDFRRRLWHELDQWVQHNKN